VWSFGVVLYEIVTLGAFPFQGLTNQQVFVSHSMSIKIFFGIFDYSIKNHSLPQQELVKSGESIKIPQQAKPPLKALMASCFSLEPKKRPGASTIVEFISDYQRMLSPCMSDIPKPNLDEQVNLLDTDINDEFEFDQLIENRERSRTPAITIDFLRPSASSSALQSNSHSQEFEYLDMKLPRRMNGGICNYSPDLTATLPNGGNYNPVEPLLINPRSNEISKSTLSLLNKYVPMCGFNKNKNRSSPEDCTSTSAL
jgi:serine/threonine protein kinase